MEAPRIKREAEDDTSAMQHFPLLPAPPHKKQKTANGYNGVKHRHAPHHNHKKQASKPQHSSPNNRYGPNPIGGLRQGLDFVLAGEFSKEAAHHAKELHNLLYGVCASGASLPESTAAEPDKITASIQTQEPIAPNRRSLTDIPPPVYGLSSLAVDRPLKPQTRPESMFFGAIGPYPEHKASTEKGDRKFPALPPITDLGLLSAPFTHSGTLPAYVPRTHLNCYENLEFLGDAYIEIIASRLIHRSFPDLAVGQWAQLRESLVCNDNLAKYSRAYGFDKQVVVTQPERETPKTFTKILADVFEAYVAAIMLSEPTNGFAIIEKWLNDLFQPAIDDWFERGGKTEHLEHINQDAKADLLKIVQARGVKIEYLEERPMQMIKPGNTQRFFIGAFFTGFDREKVRLGGGEGRSKAVAGTAAAKDAPYQ